MSPLSEEERKAQQFSEMNPPDLPNGQTWGGLPARNEPNPYLISSDEALNLEQRFTYHPPRKEQAERYAEIRRQAKEFAFFLKQNIPRCREESLALTKLEEVAFWANAAIARNE